MFPFRDHNPTKNVPYVTISLIIINFIIMAHMFMLETSSQTSFEEFIWKFAFLPANLLKIGWGLSDIHSNLIVIGTMISSMFLHGGLSHIIGNMLFLWIFGNNIEDIMGPFRFIIFYLLCGIIACLAQGFYSLHQGTGAADIPMIGASGAISGVLGAYLIKFPKAKIDTCIFAFFVFIVRLPAFLVLILWFLLQVVEQMVPIGDFEGVNQGGVAYLAHIGGFIAGMMLIKIFEKRKKTPPNRQEIIYY